MELARARYLVSPAGRRALAALPAALAALPINELSAHLRHDFGPPAAAALGEQVTLRARAADRWGPGANFLLTPDGLEMMTHPLVAARRAARLAALGLPLADLTCGLGADLAACAAAGIPVCGLEREPVTAILSSANVPGADIVVADAAHPPLHVRRFAVFIDPSRRSNGGRRFDPAAFSPPWDLAVAVLAGAAAGVLKGPPGIDHRHLPPDSEVEFVQVGRGLREAAVWQGGDAVSGLRRAVLLPAGAVLESSDGEAPGTCAPPAQFLFDPESCVTRAHLVRHLANRLTARLMDPQVAYLTASAAAFDPLCATFEVLEVVPFSVARLKQELRRRAWSPREIRRRAFPVEPDELRRLIGPVDGDPVALLCTTIAGRRTVFIARKLVP